MSNTSRSTKKGIRLGQTDGIIFLFFSHAIPCRASIILFDSSLIGCATIQQTRIGLSRLDLIRGTTDRERSWYPLGACVGEIEKRPSGYVKEGADKKTVKEEMRRQRSVEISRLCGYTTLILYDFNNILKFVIIIIRFFR